MRKQLILSILLMCLTLSASHIAKAQIIEIMGNDTIELQVSNYQYGELQWQISLDNSDYQDIENANGLTYRFFPTFESYYRAKIDIEGCPTEYSQICHILVGPEGIIDGLFSTSGNTRVYFSQGNLQYIGSAATPYWKFADRQWDYLGDGPQGSDDIYADRDLFGWGTSGWDNGNVYFQPWNTEITNTAYYGPLDDSDLTGDYANSDWGIYNPIHNGGNATESWRTLTADEWQYILDLRNTVSGMRYAKATVNDVAGVILFPDDWDADNYTLTNVNEEDCDYSGNHINASDWQDVFEANGAVFLPTAGLRYNTMVTNTATHGVYWSVSSAHDTYTAHEINFTPTNFKTSNWSMFKYFGCSVRLVKDENAVNK